MLLILGIMKTEFTVIANSIAFTLTNCRNIP